MQSRIPVLKTEHNYSNTVTSHVPVGTPLHANLPDSAVAEKEDYQPQQQFLGPFILTRQSGNCSRSKGDTQFLGPSRHTRRYTQLGRSSSTLRCKTHKATPLVSPQVSALHNYTPTQSSWNTKPTITSARAPHSRSILHSFTSKLSQR